jgi:hypothetical protein
MFGLMKIAESATAVQRSVTNVALMTSLPMPVSVSPRSTRTAYTTASEVVDTTLAMRTTAAETAASWTESTRTSY